MITLKTKHDCCGCSACAEICPKQCIKMQDDQEGFLYPQINEDTCINCHRCEKVCPVINRFSSRKPLVTLAAKNTNSQIRLTSSSGGLFDAFSQLVLKRNGVVFGVRMNESLQAVHCYIESLEGLEMLRGSKYLQSIIGDSYQQVEVFLKAGRMVLFSGTPCQIAGLKHYLDKEYKNLLTIDVVCHGVPSPKVWKEYITKRLSPKDTEEKDTILHGTKKVSFSQIGISFRDKRNGWEKFGFTVYNNSTSSKNEIFYEPMQQNIYMRGFLTDLYLRPSCHYCPARCSTSGSDITLGDYWGIAKVHPEFYDSTGISLVLLNSEKGKTLFQTLPSIKSVVSSYHSAQKYNPVLVHSVAKSSKRKQFYTAYLQNPNRLETIINQLSHISLLERIIRKIKGLIQYH